MVRFRDMHARDHAVASQCWILPDRAGAIERLRHERPDRKRRRREQGTERGIGGRSGIIGIAGDVDLGRWMWLEGHIAELELAGDELLGEETIGHVPGRGAIASGIRDLHARLVEILDEARATGSTSIGFAQRRRERFRPPHPGPADPTSRDREVAPRPGIHEGIVARRGCGDRYRRHSDRKGQCHDEQPADDRADDTRSTCGRRSQVHQHGPPLPALEGSVSTRSLAEYTVGFRTRQAGDRTGRTGCRVRQHRDAPSSRNQSRRCWFFAERASWGRPRDRPDRFVSERRDARYLGAEKAGQLMDTGGFAS